MQEGQQDGPDEIEQALQLILTAARSYRGPHGSEFAEIARRCTPSAPEELLGELVRRRDEGEEDLYVEEGTNDGLDGERHPYVTESWEPKERLAEVLAILLNVAFPPDASTERSLRGELGELLNIKVDSLRFFDGDDVVPMRQYLSKTPRKADRVLRASIQQFIPGRDSLHG